MDLDTVLTDFQKDLYLTPKLSDGILSDYYGEYNRCFYSEESDIEISGKLVNTTDNSIKNGMSQDPKDKTVDKKSTLIDYKCENMSAFLLCSNFIMTLPSLKIAEKYKDIVRIAWTPNIAAVILQSGKISISNTKYSFNTINPISNKLFTGYFPETKNTVNANLAMGNIDTLTEFSNSLPEYPHLVLKPAWFYNWHIYSSFPLFTLGTSKLVHNCTFNLNVNDLLRGQILGSDGSWTSITGDVSKYLTDGSPKTISIPRFIAHIGNVSTETIDHYTCSNSRTILIRDFVYTSSLNPEKSGKHIASKLVSNYPAICLFWMAENKRATDNKYALNFTDNSNDHMNGWDPIVSQGIFKGNTTICPDLPSSYFSNTIPDRYFPNTILEPGYHAYSFTSTPNEYNSVITRSMSHEHEWSIICKLGSTNIWNQEGNKESDIESDRTLEAIETNDSDNASTYDNRIKDISKSSKVKKEKYIFHTALLVQRKIVINIHTEGAEEPEGTESTGKITYDIKVI